MRTRMQRIIGIAIMTIGIIIGVYGLIASMGELYDASILIFLIGIIVNDWGVYRLLSYYEAKYGKIEE